MSHTAYIDESGNHDLATEKGGASAYFLVLAIIVEDSKVRRLEAEVEHIRGKYFGTGEMKSSRVKDDRRVRILEALDPLDFKFYAIAVDKSRIDKDSGLGYKKSFIKFTNGLLYKALFQNLSDVKIVADAHGGAPFIESFKLYMDVHHKPDLFSRTSVDIVDSKDHILVQLADFLVGTAARLYEDKASPAFRNVFLEFLRAKRIRIDEWPPRFEVHETVDHRSELDTEVRSIAMRSAERFIVEDSEEGDVEGRIQHCVLSYLLFRARFPTAEDFISTQEIIQHLSSQGFSDISTHYLRSRIVSRMRDRSVIIASSARGYKIPASYADVVGFAELVDGIVSPLLERLQRANDIFALGSGGKVSFLDENRFAKLRMMMSLGR